MEVLDINDFLTYKIAPGCQELDSETITFLVSLFGSMDKYKKDKKKDKKVNILKNQKLQNNKENIVNKVNLILNKLSESNVDNLLLEFMENINQVTVEEYEEIQETIYIKMMSEINFVKIYLHFIKILSYIYTKVQNYNLSYFISIVENKFKADYCDHKLSDKYSFLKDMNVEIKRINNLTLIKMMVDFDMFNNNVIVECTNVLLNQNTYLTDIYYWFTMLNRMITSDEKVQIKTLLNKDLISQREFVLLDNLINKKENESVEVVKTIKQAETPQPQNNVLKLDTFNLEVENIFEEYLLVKSYDDVKYFIEKRCSDAITKNKFCEFILDKYFSNSKSIATELLDLINKLIKNQILFKSNVSRGLIHINSEWKEKLGSYLKPKEKMTTLLNYLKNNGITKGIESLLEQYKIVITV